MADVRATVDVRRATPAAFLLVIVLAVAALLWPRSDEQAGATSLVVFDPTGDETRLAAVYAPLADVLAEATGLPVAVRRVGTVAEVRALAGAGDVYLFGPDGLALRLAPVDYVPVVAARRPPPRNLRPRGVLLRRRGAAATDAPWRTHPARTVLGDSVSLVTTGAWLMDSAVPRPAPGVAVGPDPLDHAPALHALRLGAYDYALVRQWDADRFFVQGLLEPAEWTVTEATPPVPDTVLMAPRRLAPGRRLALGENLGRVGREDGEEAAAAAALARGLDKLRLAGFNLLVEPDFERVRRLVVADHLSGRAP